MGVVILKQGRQQFVLEMPTANEIEKELRAILGPVLDLMEAKAREILEKEVKPNWPVRTGKSLKGWTTAIRVDTSRSFIEVTFHNSARTKAGQQYVKFIQSARRGKTADAVRIRSPLVEHVRKPSRAAQRALKKTIPEVLARGIQATFAKHGAR